ncbi:Kelch-type beta propeller-containing protein [Dioscorea alata]|uniref:Kelch-type beta propeller-containing protein n=1 Tax=Dioscorea alata TaxID=55571 RepID=A0ACB7U385_DIOAL|nr:Kelch-type beta propeller-containing protein [Dioscorea alata]
MVSVSNFIYIIGGKLCKKESQDQERDITVRVEVLRYDVNTREWSTCAPMTTPRFNFACAVCDEKVYVAGGQCTVLTARGTASAEVYEPGRDRWVELPGMSRLRYKCVGVVWKGRFHVIGGFAERGDDGTVMPFVVERSSVEVYDEERCEWELMPGMWQLDVPPNQIVAVGERLFSSGDCLNSWKGHVEEYDGKLGIWSVVERSQSDRLDELLMSSSSSSPAAVAAWEGRMKRVYVTMGAIGMSLYFLGGYRRGKECVRMVCTFDMGVEGREGWRSLEPVEEECVMELCSHCCVVQL